MKRIEENSNLIIVTASGCVLDDSTSELECQIQIQVAGWERSLHITLVKLTAKGSPTVCFCFVLLLSFATQSTLAATGDENWDSSFGVPGAKGTYFGVPGGNGSVHAIAINGSDVYVAGRFSEIGGVNATNIAKRDGTNWHALGAGITGGGLSAVNALVLQGQNLYVGGGFSQAGDVPANSIAKWDGTNWSSLGTGVSGPVRAIAIVGTDVYVGGEFLSAGGVGATNIAKWDGTNWFALGDGVSVLCEGIVEGLYECGGVGALAVLGGRLYAGGVFRSAGAEEVNNIAQWDGTKWSAVGAGLRTSDAPNGPNQLNGSVRALLARGTELYAGGKFSLAGSVVATNVAKWDGTNWASLGDGTGRDGEVGALAFDGTSLYVGGAYSSVGGVPAQSVAEWDGQNWSSLGSGLSSAILRLGSVQALAATGSELFVGGIFDTAGGKPSTNIALWHIPPLLSASREGEVLTLSWPGTRTNFVLETTETLPSTNWDEVYEPTLLERDRLVVTNSISSNTRYYRLRRRSN